MRPISSPRRVSDHQTGMIAPAGAAIVYGALVLGERLPPSGVLGAALILAGIAGAGGMVRFRTGEA
jgi:drug/metabolite transporter (DMT)-like permease